MLWSSLADATDDLRLPGADTTARACLTTLVFGHVVLQVVSLRSLRSECHPALKPVAGPWEDCAVAIWPAQDRRVDWPPKLTLDRDVAFHTFRRRWPNISPPLLDRGKEARSLPE